MKPTVFAAVVCLALIPASLIGAGPAGANPEDVLLTIDQINAVVANYAPGASPFDNFDPVRHQPDSPYEGLPAPCAQVLPLYFGGGEPRFSDYASLWTVGAGNVFVSQLVARYATSAQAATKFTQLVKDIPACTDALTHQPAATLALTVGDITSDSARFEQRQTGSNSSLPNRHDVAVEYRLAGASIIGVSSSQSPAVVSALAQELRGRVSG